MMIPVQYLPYPPRDQNLNHLNPVVEAEVEAASEAGYMEVTNEIVQVPP
jgi:hypothetical protein